MKKLIIYMCFLGLSVASANATLIGDDVSCSTSASYWSCDPLSAIVDESSIEFGLMVHTTFRAFDVDINSNSLNFDVLLGIGNILGLGPVSIFDIDSVITGFSYDTDIPGMDFSRLSFTESKFDVDFDGLSTGPGQYLDIVLQLESQPIPEPTSLILLGTGLSALGLVAYRRKRK